MSIDGEQCGRADIPFMMRMISSLGASVGFDHGSAVSERYESPFAFSGTLHDVSVQLPVRRATETKSEAAVNERTEMSRQ